MKLHFCKSTLACVLKKQYNCIQHFVHSSTKHCFDICRRATCVPDIVYLNEIKRLTIKDISVSLVVAG